MKLRRSVMGRMSTWTKGVASVDSGAWGERNEGVWYRLGEAEGCV